MHDITAVINGHSEGLLAQASLRSLFRSVDAARSHGLSVEALAILDRPDQLTKAVFEGFAASRTDLRIVEVEYGDLGFSRNAAVDNSDSGYVAFLDADDFWCEDWLIRAFEAAKADARDIAWHPQVNAYFGVAQSLFIHRDMEDPLFDVADLAYTNLWTSLCFTSNSLLQTVRYAGTDLRNNIGYEDWCWNIDVIERGGIHKVVPGTFHVIRSKSISLVKQTSAAGCIPRPTHLFRDRLQTETARLPGMPVHTRGRPMTMRG
jgi:hypothetical protein